MNHSLKNCIRTSLLFVLVQSAISLALTDQAQAQTSSVRVIDFESITIGDSGVLKGSDFASTNYFEVDGFRFSTTFDPGFSISEHFAVTNHSNNWDGSYANLYGSISGGGADGSRNYAVAYMNSGHHDIDTSIVDNLRLLPSISIPDFAQIHSIQISNTTYTVGTIRNGNAYAPAFDLNDRFQLTVFGIDEFNTILTPITHQLADYTGITDLADGFILSQWEMLDLQNLSNAKSLHFMLTTTDVGTNGPNTPLNFTLDNLSYSVSAIPEPTSMALCLAASVVGYTWKRRRRVA